MLRQPFCQVWSLVMPMRILCGRWTTLSILILVSKSKCPFNSLKLNRLDKLLKDQGISSDELVEVCGASGSGKTYFCLKLVSLALLEKNVAVIYIDTSNYVNQDNMTLVLRVSTYLPLMFLEFHLTERPAVKDRNCKRSAEALTRHQGFWPRIIASLAEPCPIANAEQAG